MFFFEALLLKQAALAALMFCRLAGFVAVSPFPGKWVPARVRVLLVVALALPLSFAMPNSTVQAGIGVELVLPACSDFIVGVMIGATFHFVMSASEFLAGVVSQSAWLSAPMAFNPSTGGQSQVLTQVTTLLAMLLVLAAGVHRVVLAYLLKSLALLPLGEPVHLSQALPSFIELAGRSFEVGMRLALPVFAVSLAVQSALALVARVAPSLQIFNVGFAVLVAAGLLTFAAALRSISVGFLQYAATMPELLDSLLRALVEA